MQHQEKPAQDGQHLRIQTMDNIENSSFFADNLKENDKELRAMLKRVWPKLTKKTLDRVVPKPPSLINNGKNQ